MTKRKGGDGDVQRHRIYLNNVYSIEPILQLQGNTGKVLKIHSANILAPYAGENYSTQKKQKSKESLSKQMWV